LLVALACLGVAAASASGSSTRSSTATPAVPQGFVGMVADEPLWPDPFVRLPPQLDSMVAAGVQSVRITIDWADAQPYRSWKQVPRGQRAGFVNIGGVPTNLAAVDQIVGEAAARRLELMVTVLNAPSWDGTLKKGALVRIPRSAVPFAAFAKALVRRYGPNGSFWRSTAVSPYPITMWQIWNEPNIIAFWPDQPFERRYIALLKAAHDAIKSADPKARVVLAGMPNYSWINLGRMYKIPGAGSLFDVVAVHPYTKTPAGVIKILGYVRNTMRHHGDAGKPLLADEISWPSSLGKTIHNTGYDFATTQAGQARNIAAILPLLARDRQSLGLLGFFYYDWSGQDRPDYLAFDFAGLLHFHGGQFDPKPAFDAFRRGALQIEGCSAKGGSATSCVK
jgi:hypothetical protein